ncbi:MAG: sodium:calcium antiporter [Alphaproteobacteria bacterium BRH_c36]|nr:MAG: sodium:calcium antiporter [Alphaproteobacteria bacterium BRH_c36]
MTASDLLFVVAGLVLLIVGGELLVRGAVSMAERFGMSPLLIGITLVGFGTSMPELVTSVQASLIGAPGIAIGNIVGSNIANILLILGVSALLAPIAISDGTVRRDGQIMFASAFVFFLFGFALPLDRLVGAVFIAGLVGYLYYAYRQETAGVSSHTAAFEKSEAHDELFVSGTGPSSAQMPAASVQASPGLAAAYFPLVGAIAGLVIIVAGGKLLVDGATGIARHAGVSEAVIGLTVVAIGTSLPELVTSVIAALRRHGDVALGNVIGSNIYNILGIGGVTAIVAPTSIPPEIVRFDNPVMIAVSVFLLALIWRGLTISRLQGGALVACYALYLFSLWPH